MSTVLSNKNRYAKYLTDSEFGLHSYEDIEKMSKVDTFEVILEKNDWSENAQTVENELFFAEGYSYIVTPKTSADNVQVTGAEISAMSVADGSMTFEYTGFTPSSNITLVIKREGAVDHESESKIYAVVFEGNASLDVTSEGGSSTYTSNWDAVTYQEIMAKIDEGFIPFFTGVGTYTENGETVTEKKFQSMLYSVAYESSICYIDIGHGNDSILEHRTENDQNQWTECFGEWFRYEL